MKFKLLSICLTSLFVIACGCNEQNVVQLTLQEKIVQDEDFILMVTIDQDVKDEILTGTYAENKNALQNILSQSPTSSGCEMLEKTDVSENEYIYHYFERSCKRELARQRFIDKFPSFIEMSNDERVELRQIVKQKLNTVSPQEGLQKKLYQNNKEE